jgi:hypothetical protein
MLPAADRSRSIVRASDSVVACGQHDYRSATYTCPKTLSLELARGPLVKRTDMPASA